MAQIFGVEEARVEEVVERHAPELAAIHVGAMKALLNDGGVSPAELGAVMKWQLVVGLAAMIAAEASGSIVGTNRLRRALDEVQFALRRAIQIESGVPR